MSTFRVHVLKPEWIDVPVQGICCRLWRIQTPDVWDPDVLFPKLAECLFHPPLLAKIKVMIAHFIHDPVRIEQTTCCTGCSCYKQFVPGNKQTKKKLYGP
jgi:hypothetical protein